LNADLSAAPEIARLAMPLAVVQQHTARPRTVGQLAGDLTDLAATLERWWDLVRFDLAGPLRIPVPAAHGSWLLVAPPDTDIDCDCRYATLLAGEAAEIDAAEIDVAEIDAAEIDAAEINATEINATESQAAAATARAIRPLRPLRPGRVRVHGAQTGHRLLTSGLGFSVTLHSGVTAVRSV